MDNAAISQFPHHSWFGFSVDVTEASPVVVVHQATSHTLVLAHAGVVDIRWSRGELETSYRHAVGRVAFFPRDNKTHVYVHQSAVALSSGYVLKIPDLHLLRCIESDEAVVPSEWQGFLPREDSVLQKCMTRIAGVGMQGLAHGLGSEITARRLVLRLSELRGGGLPDWHKDASAFSPYAMKTIVDYIDARLRRRICLKEISALAGLSPSHCAKKFRVTEGLSLGRFINRRRVAAAMVILRRDEVALAGLALDLGFSSQSHLTRLFSGLTGMTPAKYRKQFRQTVG
jgi:AraC family transcriptional regulator